MKPLVSILIPAFNVQTYLGEAVRSALAQTWPRKEIIIVDDGSTDETVSVARQFASEAVSVITRPHQGAAAARNHAFSQCQGDYVQWLDADDLLAPDKIERQMAVLERCSGKRTLVSAAWGRFAFRLRRLRFNPTSVWCDLPGLEWILCKMNDGSFMQTTAWLVSRELTEAAGPWDTRLLGDDDGEYFFRVILRSERVLFVPEARAAWRMRGSQRLSYVGSSREKLAAHYLGMQLQISYLRSIENSERIRTACLNYLQQGFVYFYPQCPDILKGLEELAADLDGKLAVPRLDWKYEWIRKVFGWGVAKRVGRWLPNLKRFFWITYDRGMFLFEQRISGDRSKDAWPAFAPAEKQIRNSGR